MKNNKLHQQSSLQRIQHKRKNSYDVLYMFSSSWQMNIIYNIEETQNQKFCPRLECAHRTSETTCFPIFMRLTDKACNLFGIKENTITSFNWNMNSSLLFEWGYSYLLLKYNCEEWLHLQIILWICFGMYYSKCLSTYLDLHPLLCLTGCKILT